MVFVYLNLYIKGRKDGRLGWYGLNMKNLIENSMKNCSLKDLKEW